MCVHNNILAQTNKPSDRTRGNRISTLCDLDNIHTANLTVFSCVVKTLFQFLPSVGKLLTNKHKILQNAAKIDFQKSDEYLKLTLVL